jgi:Ca2+-binding RTX toxin-like protein
MQKVVGSNPISRSSEKTAIGHHGEPTRATECIASLSLPECAGVSRPLIVLAAAALASFGGAGEAVARGTASINGPTLVYSGDDAREFGVIDKEPVRDENGTTVGAEYSVQDTRIGGVVTGSPPCRNEHNGVRCPFGSSTLQVSLGGGDDFFETGDRTLGKGFEFGQSCLPVQATAALRLDGGPGRDIVDGSRLGDTIAGGTGNDAISSWDGNDRVTGGPGVDLLETDDGNDVADGGTGNDVIHLDANPRSTGESCFRPSGRPYKDIGRGGPGNDAIQSRGGGDRLEGGSGNDDMGVDLRGGGGNTLLGGPGRDTIWSRDGHRDYVNCGSGRDLLEASDRSDRVVGCEKRFLRPR